MKAKLRILRDLSVRTAGARNTPQIVAAELSRVAPTDQQQALGFQPRRFMQQISFKTACQSVRR